MTSRRPTLGIKSGPQRVYEYLLDKPVGYRVSEATHLDHIPLHTGTLSASLFGLEKQGVVKPIGKVRFRAPNSSRTMPVTVFEWLGPSDDIQFRAGHRPGHSRPSGKGGFSGPRRKLDIIDGSVRKEGGKAILPQELNVKPDPRSKADLEKAWSDAQSSTPPLHLEPGQPVQVLPPQPTLSEQLLLLAIRIDRARKPGTPSGVFKHAQQARDVALPRRSEVIEKLLELATLAEQLESEAKHASADVKPYEENWKY